MPFSTQLLNLAAEFKRLGLPWEPSVGNYVYDAAGAVTQSSPFQDRVYFLLNYDCFMQKVGGLARFKEIMTWLPTWSDARAILQAFGVANAEVSATLIRTDAINTDTELLVLYEMIAEQLRRKHAAPLSEASV